MGGTPRFSTSDLVPPIPKVPRTPKIPRTPNSRGQYRPARRRGGRGVILAVLVLATIVAVLITVLHGSSAFAVSGVQVGDYVKVDKADHITGKIAQKAATDDANGRQVLAREDQRDPAICKKFHYTGHSDVEPQGSVSFCLVHPTDKAGAPQQ